MGDSGGLQLCLPKYLLYKMSNKVWHHLRASQTSLDMVFVCTCMRAYPAESEWDDTVRRSKHQIECSTVTVFCHILTDL